MDAETLAADRRLREAEAAIKRSQAQQQVALDFAVKQARRYIKFARESNGADGARYTMAEYLRVQGVRKDLIEAACRMAEEAWNGIA